MSHDLSMQWLAMMPRINAQRLIEQCTTHVMATIAKPSERIAWLRRQERIATGTRTRTSPEERYARLRAMGIVVIDETEGAAP